MNAEPTRAICKTPGCGKKLQSNNRLGYCNRKECKNILDREQAARIRALRPPRATCKGCGKKLRSDNRSGYCSRRECQKAWRRERWARAAAVRPSRATCRTPGCGHLLNVNNRTGYCQQRRDCRDAGDRERAARIRALRPPVAKCKHCGEKELARYNRTGYCQRQECQNVMLRERRVMDREWAKKLDRRNYERDHVFNGRRPRKQYYGDRTASWAGGRYCVCKECGEALDWRGPSQISRRGTFCKKCQHNWSKYDEEGNPIEKEAVREAV